MVTSLCLSVFVVNPFLRYVSIGDAEVRNRIPDHLNTNRPPRVAASTYLNTAPLIWSFLHGPRKNDVRLAPDASPARCASLLARGEVEAALVPVIEYQRIPEIAVVPGVCVGSHSAVRSVVIASRYDDLKAVRRVALDGSSRTSVALVEILFREFFGFAPEWEIAAPNLDAMLTRNDAALIIGDPAMTMIYGTWSRYRTGSGSDRVGAGTDAGGPQAGMPALPLHVFDLATLWREHTGLGFVFAMWMALEGAAERIRVIDLPGARDEGLAHVDEIAASYEPLLNLPQAELRTYLTENISFSLDEEMRAGMELFFKLAYKHGIIPEVHRLKMIDE